MDWIDKLKSSEPIVKVNPLVVIAILIEILFVIFVVISIVRVVNKEQKPATLSIDNYSAATEGLTLANLPGEINSQYREIIDSTIYDTVKLNNNSTTKNKGAQIRSDSVVSAYIEDLDTKFLNFIIDIPDLEQSYRVIYRDRQSLGYRQVVDDTPVAVVYCLRDDELIYDTFNCRDQYDGRGEAYVIAWALAGHNFEHSYPGMVLDTALVPEPSISIVTNSTSETENDTKPGSRAKTVEQQAITEVAEFLSTLGFDLENYPYSAGPQGLNLPEQL